MAARHCLSCGRLIKAGSRCSSCETTNHDAAYGGNWRKVSKSQRRAVPRCECLGCSLHEGPCPATTDLTADHVVPHAMGGTARLTRARSAGPATPPSVTASDSATALVRYVEKMSRGTSPRPRQVARTLPRNSQPVGGRGFWPEPGVRPNPSKPNGAPATRASGRCPSRSWSSRRRRATGRRCRKVWSRPGRHIGPRSGGPGRHGCRRRSTRRWSRRCAGSPTRSPGTATTSTTTGASSRSRSSSPKGDVVGSKIVPNPALASLRKAEESRRRGLIELGFSPTARARLGLAQIVIATQASKLEALIEARRRRSSRSTGR